MAPLDWGLGHATRCIPIINGFLSSGYEVLLAAEGRQASLLRQEFPQLTCLPLKGYRVRYSCSGWQLPFIMLMQLPRLFSIIKKEKRWLDRVIDEHRIDLVVSDNRYGLSTSKKPCVFITHQLTVKMPFAWLEKQVQRISYSYINRFTACWVPDIAEVPGAAGVLSHPEQLPAIPVHYLGLLARFTKKDVPPVYDYCILLSGPEPQRSILEKKIVCELAGIPGKILLVRGLPGSKEILVLPEHIEVRNHLGTKELEEALQQSEYIVSRSGYTTVMELLWLGKKSILVPTPGQTEQEFLAEKMHGSGWCFAITQNDFRAAEHFEAAKQFSYVIPPIRTFHPENIEHLLEAL